MPILISAHRLAKGFGARPLFDELTFAIEAGERIGLIGPNGAGKSTLMQILAKRISPDSGDLSSQRGLKVGYLEQAPTFPEGATLLSTALEGTETGDSSDWESEAAAREALALLPLESAGLTPESIVADLSGGWQKRAALARELARKPDILFLDEPTNHLDVEGILWLEELLNSSPFATVTVTHDRVFLQSVSSRILELDRRNAGGLLSVQGSYADYLELKESNLQTQERQEVIMKNTLRRETEWLRRGAKARTTKQQARIHRAGELKDSVAELEYRNQKRVARIDFQSTDRSPKKLIEAKGLTKAYGDRTLFKNLDLLLTPGTRIGLLGPNGCGKSTLIRTLVGDETPDVGDIRRADQLSVAYFGQHRDTLDPTITVSKTLCPTGDHVDYRGTRVHIRGYLDRFLFSQGQMEMAVGKLSGGEQSRLLIARLMLKESNLLVLDEPTNDLDIATLNVLQDCLTEFPGAILLVSHDRYFLDQVANRILAFDPESGGTGILSFADLDQWEVWRAQRATKAGRPAPVAAKSESARTKLSYKDQREWDQMEDRIRDAELKTSELETKLADPSISSNSIRVRELAAELAAAQKETERLYARWAELEALVGPKKS